jgi:hypothetical protein
MQSATNGSSVTLRATGIARYFGAAFLAVWLAGWLVGEVLALGFLGLLIRSTIGAAAGREWPIPGGDWIAGGAAGFVLLFLLVWLTLWTVGGVTAIHELFRSLAGADHVSVRNGDVELVRRAGPLRRRKTFERARVRHVLVRRHDTAVVLHTDSGTEEITKYGTATERRELAEWLRRQLALPQDGLPVDPLAAPPGWTMTMGGGGVRISQLDVRSRRIAASIVWAIAGLIGLVWYGSTETGQRLGSVVAFLLLALLVCAAAWVTWSRREWLVRHGELVSHRRFGGWQRERSFGEARLEVEESTDSDNDRHYKLTVTDARGAVRIASVLNDEAEVLDLARWLAARTGFPLRVPDGL